MKEPRNVFLVILTRGRVVALVLVVTVVGLLCWGAGPWA